jgi:YD repeat-containing protein
LKRAKQVLGGEVVYSVYGLSGAVLYRDNITTGVATDYIRAGGMTIARLKTVSGSTTVSYLHQDHLGSPAAATDAPGRLASLSYGNGFALSNTYNNRQLLTGMTVVKGVTKAVDFSYAHDANGRITSITDGAVTGQDRSFTYDGLGRVWDWLC